MRRLLGAVCIGFGMANALACNCFPPELRAKTAQEALEKSNMAVMAEVQAVDARQTARLVVLESFKGLSTQTFFDAEQDLEQCGEMRFAVGEKWLFISFKDKVTACDKHPSEHYMVQEFRRLQVK